jgi:hypothetical protein
MMIQSAMTGRRLHDPLDSVMAKGWTVIEDVTLADVSQLSKRLGIPIPCRTMGRTIDLLRPLERKQAHPHSLSSRYGTGRFPFHTDAATHLIPPRFLLLWAPVISVVPTLLLDTRPLIADHRKILERGIFAVNGGTTSFYTSLLSCEHKLVRFDEDCMIPSNSMGLQALDVVRDYFTRTCATAIEWNAKRALLIDNHRMVHARENCKDSINRILVRILVRENLG